MMKARTGGKKGTRPRDYGLSELDEGITSYELSCEVLVMKNKHAGK